MYPLYERISNQNFGKATYIVREVHGKIAAFALLFPPDHKESSVLKDFLYGAIKIVSILGIRKALAFNKFLDASTEAFEYTVDEEHWHLDQFRSFAINAGTERGK